MDKNDPPKPTEEPKGAEPDPGAAKPEEHQFMKRDGVKVTNIRVLVGTDTYALANITSCRARTVDETYLDTRFAPARRIIRNITIFVIIAALLIGLRRAAFWDAVLASLGFYILMLIINWFLRDREKSEIVHKIFLGDTIGEREAVVTKDPTLVNEILKAVNEAIISRG